MPGQVTPEWVTASLQRGSWAPEEEFAAPVRRAPVLCCAALCWGLLSFSASFAGRPVQQHAALCKSCAVLCRGRCAGDTQWVHRPRAESSHAVHSHTRTRMHAHAHISCTQVRRHRGRRARTRAAGARPAGPAVRPSRGPALRRAGCRARRRRDGSQGVRAPAGAAAAGAGARGQGESSLLVFFWVHLLECRFHGCGAPAAGAGAGQQGESRVSKQVLGGSRLLGSSGWCRRGRAGGRHGQAGGLVGQAAPTPTPTKPPTSTPHTH
jgi:hypothetical protein